MWATDFRDKIARKRIEDRARPRDARADLPNDRTGQGGAGAHERAQPNAGEAVYCDEDWQALGVATRRHAAIKVHRCD